AEAVRAAHASKGAGKWTRKCRVSIVRQGADGDCARPAAASSHNPVAKRASRLIAAEASILLSIYTVGTFSRRNHATPSKWNPRAPAHRGSGLRGRSENLPRPRRPNGQ